MSAVVSDPAKKSYVKYTKTYIHAMETRIAKDYYGWFLAAITTNNKREFHWLKDGVTMYTESTWNPASNNEQCFTLLSFFDLLGTNRSELDRVIRAARIHLDDVARENPYDPHAATRLAIVEACVQILLRENMSQETQEQIMAAFYLH